MKIKLEKGLKFNKEVITKLNDNQLTDIKGGAEAIDAEYTSCKKKSCNGKDEVISPSF